MIAKRHELLRFAFQSGVSAATGYTFHYADQLIGGDHAALDRRARFAQRLSGARRAASRRVVFAARSAAGQHAPLRVDRRLRRRRQANGRSLSRRHVQHQHPAGKRRRPPRSCRSRSIPFRFVSRCAWRTRGWSCSSRTPTTRARKTCTIHDFNVDANIDSSNNHGLRGARRLLGASPKRTVHDRRQDRRDSRVRDASRARAAGFRCARWPTTSATRAALKIIAGRARNFDARLYSLDVQPNLPSSYHVNLQLDLAGAKMVFSGDRGADRKHSRAFGAGRQRRLRARHDRRSGRRCRCG